MCRGKLPFPSPFYKRICLRSDCIPSLENFGKEGKGEILDRMTVAHPQQIKQSDNFPECAALELVPASYLSCSSPWGRHEELAEITWPQTASAAKNLFPIRQQHARSAVFARVVAHVNKYRSALAQTGIASAQESQKYDDESMFFEPIRPTTPLLDKPVSVNFVANPDAATKRSR